MSVSMAKTPNHTTGKAISTKVPFKKVFSSSHLQTNGINGGQVNEHKSHRGRCSNDFGTMAHANLSSQLSSSLPGILDNVNSSQPRRATGSMEKGASARSSQKSTNSASSSNAVIESLSKGSVLRTGQNIPFSAIEPSMIVSLSTYLNSLNNFDSEKLVKEIQLMLTYFEDVVKKDKLEQLVGSSTILMETVDANCLKLKNAYLQLQQVQLRLQLLMQSFNMDDDSDTLAKIRSSPVIEANNDLYRNLSELIQWSDQVSVMHNLIENGDRRIPTNGESCSPEQATHVPEPARPSTQENVKMAQTVSHNLLQSFKNLVKAYKNMETELRHCYDDCLHANKQMADLILAENTSANRSLNSMRRRSITPPPDYSLSSSGVTHRVPNGSTSTIASSTSSSSSTSSHFLGRHRFFPNLTNHAQKMAHHFEKKLLNKTNKKDTSPVSGKNASDNVTDKHSWSLWPLLGSSNNLKRSESASDISSIPRNSYLDIPAENSGQTQRGKRSPSPFRKHSVNELGNTKSPDCLTLPNTPIKLNSPNRKSSASQVNRHSDGNESRPMNAPFVAPPKEMLFNPLYFTPHHQSLSPDNSTPNAQPVPGLVTSPSSSPSSTHSKYSIRDELSSNTVECDRPPPLPPKTYQSRSMSSTRSSIASNTSSSSSSSKDCQRFPLKDTDSGLGTMPASSCDLETRNVLKCCANHGPRQNFPACMHVCGHRPAMYNQEILSPSHSTCSFHDSWQHTHHHCGCLAASSASNAEMSQVTLRPKKNRGRTQKCDHERSASPPPLPPPDSILFSLDSVDSIGKDSHPSHCCHSRSCVDERNKENYNCNSPCHCTQHNTTFGQCSNICPQHSTPPTCTCQSRRHVRTYRREHKTQSMAFTKSVRSYSIAESSTSTLKSSLTSTSLTVDCSNSMSHSTSFPQRLSSCDSQPPPLPPKRRNMHAYMVVVGNYSGPIDTSDLFRYTSSNFTKSMIETKTLHAIRQNSTSSSVMSLSSSASSSSSLCTSASSPNNAITVTADHLDKQQYLHLPIAPPPPTNEGTSPDKSLTPPPPRLPPRRDKLNELPIAPPPPPLVSSSSVIQQRMQQAQNNFSEQALLIAPRSSTPVKQSEPCPCLRSPSIEQPEESLGFVEEEEVIEEMAEEELEPDEELPMMVVEEDKPSGFCVYCSEGTVHEEEECVLSQTDVPGRLLTPKTQEDEDDLGDLAIRAGTIDALVVKATQANATGADATFLYTFLTTYRSFLRPDQLINKLIFRYNQFTTKIERTDIVRQSVASKVAKFIVLVVTEFYLYDFSKSLAQTLMDFIYQLVGRGDLAHAKCLREKCFEKLRQRDREISAATNKLTTYNVITRTATLLDFKSEHIAEQMTLLDAGLFHKIEIPEIMIWAKEQKEELIPNLSRFTEHFNKMSFWTRSQILSCEEHKEREKYVLKFLKIMKHLRKLNNFNSYLAILSALGSASISRLDWQKNITEAMRESHALIDSSSSFRTYRTVLAMTKPPCIPYIGLILQDLTFVHIGNSDYMPDGKVNFAKHFKQFSILSQMKQFQQCKYSINENEQIISFFDNFDNYLQEEVMWQISESIKPRGGGNNSMNTNASS